MNEELERLVSILQAQGASMSEIQNAIAQYKQANQAASSGPEPTPSTPVADQQEIEENVGIPKESSIDQDWWNNAGLDRGSYFDEQGEVLPEPISLTVVDPGWDQIRLEEENAIKTQAALESAERYDSSDISEGEGDVRYRTQRIVENNVATEKQKKENAEKASADYQEFVDTSFAYNSITDEDVEAEKVLRDQYEADYTEYVYNSPGMKDGGSRIKTKEEYVQR